MTQTQHATTLRALHQPGTPLVLYNIWDAGSAAAIHAAGAKALATGSWSVAAAQGYGDGQQMPLDLLLTLVTRIAQTVPLPLTVDFEGGFATTPADLAANIARLIATGTVGLNFEDQIIGGTGLHPIADQSHRIATIRGTANTAQMPLVINARTDLFLQAKDPATHAALIPETLARAAAYATAGADSFFVPGLTDPTLIAALCTQSPLPINVLVLDTSQNLEPLATLGVARISFGPAPYRRAMASLTQAAQTALSSLSAPT